MIHRYEKLDISIAASEQLPKLRTLCHYLIDQSYAKKTGSKHIKPIPLFNKHATTYPVIDSIDAVTGNKFLQGRTLTATTASRLMNWLYTNFAWAFVTITEEESPWLKLIHSEAYHDSFAAFKVASDNGNKLIDQEALQQAVYKGLNTIDIKQQWYLTLEGEADDNFIVILQSADKTTQIAPLAAIDNIEPFLSVIPANKHQLRYPSRVNLSFSKEDGLGRRSCVVIKAPFLVIPSKTIDTDLSLSPTELDQFAVQLMQEKQFSIDQYSFMLVDN